MEKDFLEIARTVSGYQKAEFADIIGVDLAFYQYLELHPDHINLRMIELLLPRINRHSLRIMHDAVNAIFISFE